MIRLPAFLRRKPDLDPPVPADAYREAVTDLLQAEVRADAEALRANRAEAELTAIRRQRSDATRRGNVTRKAKVLARAAELRGEVA